MPKWHILGWHILLVFTKIREMVSSHMWWSILFATEERNSFGWVRRTEGDWVRPRGLTFLYQRCLQEFLLGSGPHEHPHHPKLNQLEWAPPTLNPLDWLGCFHIKNRLQGEAKEQNTILLPRNYILNTDNGLVILWEEKLFFLYPLGFWLRHILPIIQSKLTREKQTSLLTCIPQLHMEDTQENWENSWRWPKPPS